MYAYMLTYSDLSRLVKGSATYTPYPLIRNPLIRNESLESIRKTYTNPIQPYQSLLEIRNSRSLVNIYIYIVFLLGGRGVYHPMFGVDPGDKP